MAVSIVKVEDVQRGTGPGLRKLYITGVNTVDGTGELLDHGCPGTPDKVVVAVTKRSAALYEEPTTYVEEEASRSDTQVKITSIGTSSAVTATVYLEYTQRANAADAEDAGEGVL